MELQKMKSIYEHIKMYAADKSELAGARHASQYSFYAGELIQCLAEDGLIDHPATDDITSTIEAVIVVYRQMGGYLATADNTKKSEVKQAFKSSEAYLTLCAALQNQSEARFVLEDTGGDNYVTGIAPLSDGGYRVNGTNCRNEPRFIDVHPDGTITGYGGSLDLGIVGNQMARQLENILDHFNYQPENTPFNRP
ncbi:MAG: hypothetical protein P1U32_07505 [Legionellaceae bacterium]|nr:hypothetical protein [Legionellaceae bacterium]